MPVSDLFFRIKNCFLFALGNPFVIGKYIVLPRVVIFRIFVQICFTIRPFFQPGEGERLTYGEMLLELSGKNRGKRVYSFGTMLRPGRSEMKGHGPSTPSSVSSDICAGAAVS